MSSSHEQDQGAGLEPVGWSDALLTEQLRTATSEARRATVVLAQRVRSAEAVPRM
ncbi:hypothetical protein [Streptomyces agglomeratus]|uniref:hypothetical protein n=1 Tax=Streptomyces agglomeratus TaxID=285458 RepID=UPI00159F2C62|nr:hypothetical protein [Streptomyces agglomeratus]